MLLGVVKNSNSKTFRGESKEVPAIKKFINIYLLYIN